MSNTIIYARVSTDEQAAKGTSIPYQKERLEQYCNATGYPIVKYFAEDYSAKNFEDRPEFNKLLAFVKANKGVVKKLLVVRWDRFSRNAPEAYNMIGRLAKLGIEVNAIEQPIDFDIPEQKVMLSFYLTIPEVENDRRSMNTINGMRKNKKQGRWLGLAPFGYKNARDSQDKPIIIKTEKAELVRKSFELAATGEYPADALRKQMQKEGLQISKNQFLRMLRNRIYCGQIELKIYRNEPEEIIQGIHEPIVNEALFNEVQNVLEGKKKINLKMSKIRDEFPMRGYLVCNSCGGNLTASCSKGRNDKYFYYHCQNGCKERISNETVHSTFTQWLSDISIKPQVGQLYLSVMQDIFKNNEKDRGAEITRLSTEICKKEEMLDKATRKLINDELDKESYNRIKGSLQKETIDLKTRISELKETESGFMEYLTFGVTLLGNLPHYYSTATLEGKQKMLGSIFPEKLIFSENSYRTAQPNELIELFSSVTKAFGDSKKKKAAIFSGLSHQGTVMGLEPTTLRTTI
jgi:site-specific DNA recombinase